MRGAGDMNYLRNRATFARKKEKPTEFRTLRGLVADS